MQLRIITILVLLIGLCFGSCSSHTRSTTLRSIAGGMYAGGEYRINMLRGNPSGLDPVIISSKLADDIALQLYDRLISFDSSLRVQPELAKSWEISDDGRVYTFHLRSDVFFHDDACFEGSRGRRMVARDVVYSLTRCCDPRTRSVAFWVFKDKVLGADSCYNMLRRSGPEVQAKVEGLQCPNDSTLKIILTRPYSPFLMQLSNALGCVVPEEAIIYYGKDFFRHPVGTGAFVFDHWDDDREIVLKRNSHYWKFDQHGNRQPYLDRVVISFLTDDKIQFQEFLSGNLEESFTIPTEMFPVFFNQETKQPRTHFNFIVQQRPALLSWFIDFHCGRYPFNNVDVRRAFACAIDKEKLVHYVLRNAPYAAAHNGITPPVLPGYDIDDIPGYHFNPAKARGYLAAAGYANGKGFPVVELSVYPEPRLLQVAESVQNMLREVLNIDVRIQVLQFAQLLDKSEAGQLSMWGTRWYGDYPDAENFVSLWDGSLVPADSTQPSYPNSTRYNNPAVNTMIEQASRSTDNNQRLALYKHAESLASVDVPALMLFYEMHYRFIQPYVRNYPLDALNRIQLKDVWYDATKMPTTGLTIVTQGASQ